MTRFTFGCPVRWSDVDAYGHVNNVVYLTYLEEARVGLFEQAEASRQRLDAGVVVARHEIEYRAPLLPRTTPVPVETWVRRVGNSSVTFGYEVVDTAADGTRTTYAVASSVLVPVNVHTGSPCRVSPEEKAALAGYVLADGPHPGTGSSGAGSPVSRLPVPGSSPPEHVFTCPVRWSDLDAFNHVNNVTFLEYLQEARVHFAHWAGVSVGSGEPHEGAVVVHQQIDYVAPLRLRPEPVQVAVGVARIGRSSYTLTYEVRDELRVYARASSTQVAYDLTQRAARPLAPGERDILERFTVGSPTAAAASSTFGP